MDRAGKAVNHLQDEELVQIFAIVRDGGSREEARKLLSGRDRNTVNRACNVAAAFQRRNLSSLDEAVSQKIADEAGYSTTGRYIRDTFSKWKAFKSPGYAQTRPQIHRDRLVDEAERLCQQLVRYPLETVVPNNSRVPVALQALRRQTEKLGLPHLMDYHDQLAGEYQTLRAGIANQLEQQVTPVRRSLPKGVSIHAWEQHILTELEAQAVNTGTTWPPTYGYTAEKDGAFPARVRLWWGGHTLTVQPVASDQVPVVHQPHEDLVNWSQKFLAPLHRQYASVQSATDDVLDQLEALEVEWLVPGL